MRDIYRVLHFLDPAFIEKKDNWWEHCVSSGCYNAKKGVLRRKLIVEYVAVCTYFFVHDRCSSETLGIGSDKRRGYQVYEFM